MKKCMPLFLAILLVCGTGIFSNQTIVNAEEKEVTITLLATSDIHGRFMPWDYAIDGPNLNGSLTQLYTTIKNIRKENPNTILLDNGDLIQDNSAELFNDQPQSPMMVAINEMGFEAWTYGNHEFNFGLDVLDKVSSQYKGPKLAGNVYKENGERFLPASTIIERDGVKIGIIGMVTPLIVEYEKGTNHLDGLVVKNPVEETKKAVKELEGKVDVMIGLMHMGLENENSNPGTGVKEIANAVPELAAIFAGHNHVLIKKEDVNGVLITEPNKYGTHISRIDLTFTRQGTQVVLKDKDASVIPVKAEDGTILESDSELETHLKPYHEFARADANIVVAQLKETDLVPKNEMNGIPAIHIQETPLSDLFHEVMLHYSKADVVSHQIDNDKASLAIGPIMKKDIAYNYQFAGGEVSVYEVTGKDLKDYMEWSAGYFNSTRPGDVTTSFDKTRRSSKYSTNDYFGNVKYDIDLTEQKGNRIKNLRKLDGSPIQNEDKLKLGMNSYRMDFLLSKGQALEGRKFNMLWSSKDESAYGETGGTIRNLTIKYLKEEMKGEYKPVIQDNWKIVGVDTKSPARSAVVDLVNKGILEIPATEDGKFTNIASINVNDTVTKQEINALSLKAKVSESLFSEVKTTGEFYQKLSQVLTNPVPEDDKGKDKPVEPVKPIEPVGPVKPAPDEVKPAPSKPEPGKDKPVLVKPSKSTPDKIKPVTVKGEVTAHHLNVRFHPANGGKVYGTVPMHTELTILGVEKGFYKISYNGKIAYVSSRYVKVQK
ncbi:5'-nucleotidase C-terminal domain-containing protein [Sporosarcina limicola]|uniref:2',3'-cyclic-nucleotide 2'-phosphodiesterase/3'-nucleotidase n=1 Tax=Sporosarcina limicola TaxID=34101 RepID=A0A927R4Y5_9BACL|nr:5'-nucleotidase C-terminal domain-containing protein [Sporosarcina limicola]MBE1553364.1 2',3'-cyclic-nucleotide 2'-phosphodiesterase/3'-nucleotidase [Sporosarcina limicola]